MQGVYLNKKYAKTLLRRFYGVKKIDKTRIFIPLAQDTADFSKLKEEVSTWEPTISEHGEPATIPDVEYHKLKNDRDAGIIKNRYGQKIYDITISPAECWYVIPREMADPDNFGRIDRDKLRAEIQRVKADNAERAAKGWRQERAPEVTV